MVLKWLTICALSKGKICPQRVGCPPLRAIPLSSNFLTNFAIGASSWGRVATLDRKVEPFLVIVLKGLLSNAVILMSVPRKCVIFVRAWVILVFSKLKLRQSAVFRNS